MTKFNAPKEGGRLREGEVSFKKMTFRGRLIRGAGESLIELLR